MANVQQISEITPSFAFTEYDFFKDYEESFKKSELGRIHSILPLREMAVRFGLTDPHPHKKAGRKSYFSPEGKVALMFLKSYSGLSAPKLMEQLNANIHYQLFCGIRICSRNPLTNYKLIDDIALDLSFRLKIQNQQEALAETWKPYMKNLDTLYTDATCYESAMRYPTDTKLLWECIEKVYPMMCGASRELGVHRMRTKYLDVSRDNMVYVKQRRHTQKRTRKIIHRMLELLGKMLAELRRLDRENPCVGLFSESQLAEIETITKIYRQQRNHHESGNAKESIPNKSFIYAAIFNAPLPIFQQVFIKPLLHYCHHFSLIVGLVTNTLIQTIQIIPHLLLGYLLGWVVTLQQALKPLNFAHIKPSTFEGFGNL